MTEEGAGDAAEEDPSDCIPLQLQRLFGQLQLSERDCVETRALTDSFGWTAQVSRGRHLRRRLQCNGVQGMKRYGVG